MTIPVIRYNHVCPCFDVFMFSSHQVSFACDENTSRPSLPVLIDRKANVLQQNDEKLLSRLCQTLRSGDSKTPDVIELMCHVAQLSGFSLRVLGRGESEEETDADWLKRFVVDDVMSFVGQSRDGVVIGTAVRAAASLEDEADCVQLMSAVLKVRLSRLRVSVP